MISRHALSQELARTYSTQVNKLQKGLSSLDGAKGSVPPPYIGISVPAGAPPACPPPSGPPPTSARRSAGPPAGPPPSGPPRASAATKRASVEVQVRGQL